MKDTHGALTDEIKQVHAVVVSTAGSIHLALSIHVLDIHQLAISLPASLGLHTLSRKPSAGQCCKLNVVHLMRPAVAAVQ